MAASQNEPNLASLQRHKEYYLPGGDLYFLVENYHFRVHRYFFERESSYFRDKLSHPASPGALPEGTSESNSIFLADTKVHELERLLWVFYNPKYSLYNTGITDWLIILDLAHRWSFPEVKALAIREVEAISMPDIDRIVLYRKYNVDETILIPRYAALCARPQTLTYQEGLQLGMKTALTIARARECARSGFESGGRSPLPEDFRDEDVHSLVRDLFELHEPDPGAGGKDGKAKTNVGS